MASEEMRVANIIDLRTRVTAIRVDSDGASDWDRYARRVCISRVEIFGKIDNLIKVRTCQAKSSRKACKTAFLSSKAS